ncbi:MAG: 4-hydroxy-tetrahydrodipicolinate reductase [Parasphingopyxis sp.]|nr:4-hydroxy-tetrahydrodipicolinate reductase [Sphingomonadales bacterium]
MTGIGILGSEGRMGRAIAALLDSERAARCAGGIGREGSPEELARRCDVLVDFSAPDALEAHLAAARTAGTPMLVGTTGLSQAHQTLLDEAAGKIAVLQAANTSLGVNLLAHLVREAAARLGEEWDIEIAEMHHRHKKDAPSGTALLLGEAAAEGRGTTLGEVAEQGRAGLDCERTEGAIGFASLRGGSVAGEHTVIFAGEGERLELAHRAESREIFARGAIRAAVWLAEQKPGRYAMADVLEL